MEYYILKLILILILILLLCTLISTILLHLLIINDHTIVYIQISGLIPSFSGLFAIMGAAHSNIFADHFEIIKTCVY